jgi:dolichol-phosphate mannosyltransferase
MPSDTSIVLTIIIPFHHEEESIEQTLCALQGSLTVPREILLVHDDKDDPALRVINDVRSNDASIRVLLNSHKPGVPGAIKTGLEASSGKYILFLVADDQGPMAIINPMLDQMEKGYDLVSGTRYIKGGGMSGSSNLAKFASALGNRLFCLLTLSKLSDLTTGIKMFRKDILKRIDLKADADWTIAFELAVQAQVNHLKVTEIPYHSYNRTSGGKSHFKVMPRIFKYGKVFLWGVARFWRK